MKPAFLLDSSVCIAVLRNKAGLDQLPDPAKTGIPVIVVAELWTGVQKNLKIHPHQEKRLEAFLDLFLTVDFTSASAKTYGEIRAELEATGETIGPLDMLIAAQARSTGAAIVTANAKEFKRVKGLKVQVWK